jgi:hypothetical protein
MSTLIFTRDGNEYYLSNHPKGNECRYTLGEYTLSVHMRNARNLFFTYKKGTVVIPYYMIENVIYNDSHGELLYRYIWSKNNNGEILDTPPLFPVTPPEYDVMSRDRRVFGQQIYSEFPLESYV